MNEQPPLWHRALTLLRRADQHIERHLTELLEGSALFGERTAFRVRAKRGSFEDFAGSIESIRQTMEETQQAARRGVDLPFVLGTSRKDPMMTLSYQRDASAPRGAYDTVDIGFDLNHPLVGDNGHFSFTDLMKYIGLAVDTFDAASAAVHDSRLQELVTSTYSREMAKSQLPPSEHKYLPVAAIEEITPQQLVRRLSHYAHPSSFDATKIPQAVYWINYWDRTLVKSVGEDRIQAAPWAFVAKHPRGGLLLATQKEEFDALNKEHLERVAKLADALDLYALQTAKRKR
jgi:hypothetical protein